MDLFNNFFNGKRVLITGHTGFKGSWLAIWLRELGANVIGYSLDPITPKDNFILTGLDRKIIDIRGDIRDKEKLNSVFNSYCPEIVFHLAAQPLVRLSYEKPFETYDVNFMGSIAVMEAATACKDCKVIIMVTTDKCYENKEQIWGYRENDSMGGLDPYSSSKGALELAISAWRHSFCNPSEFNKHGKAIASVRAGNVIGGGDWAKDRLIPDCIKHIENDETIIIRNPKAIRPWQYVLEPLSGYLLLAEKLWSEPIKFCEGWNFGPSLDSIMNVEEVAKLLLSYYGKGKIMNDKFNDHDLYESKTLLLDISKVINALKWKPKLKIEQTIKLTSDWYKQYNKTDVYKLCINQIKFYTEY